MVLSKYQKRRHDIAICILWLALWLQPAASANAQNQSNQQADVQRAVSQGRGKEALADYEKQALLFENLAASSDSPRKNWVAASRAFRTASIAARYIGEFEKSILYAQKALAFAENLDDHPLKLRAIGSLELAYLSTRDFTKTAELIELGFKIAGELPTDSSEYLWWHSRIYHKRGREFVRQREYQKAIDDFQKAISLNEAFLTRLPQGNESSQGRVEIAMTLQLNSYRSLAVVYTAIGKFDLALETYRQALRTADEWGLEFSKGDLHVGMGDVLRSEDDFTGALQHYRSALELGRRQHRPDILINSTRSMAAVLYKTNRPVEAVAFYNEAIEQTESVRSLLANPKNRQSFFEDGLSAYRGMVEALWSTKAVDRAFDFSERARSRSFLDLLGTKMPLARQTSGVREQRIALVQTIAIADQTRNRRINRAANDAERAYLALLEEIRKQDREQASLFSVEPLTLTQVQALLEPGQVLLEYFVTPQQVYLWVVGKEHLQSFSVRLSRTELIKKLEALRSAISERKPLKEYQALAGDLYEQLIAPAETSNRGKELIIVPHDMLHNLPFHALVAKDGRYLIEKSPIQYLSSASLIQFTQAKRRVLGTKVLALGNPVVGDSVKELKSAEQETAELKKQFPGTTLLRRNEATKDKVKALAHGYDILHFAAHTELKPDDPLSSAVLLAKTGTDDGRLAVRDIFGMDLKASLVVLSGCETALGKLSSGDELVGLTRAFIYAGTPSVIASLWKVDDASTAALMSGFYKNLKTKSKVESLRHAQLAMIRGKLSTRLLAQRGVGGIGKLGDVPAPKSLSRDSISVSTAHPYFWAPFILVGDGK